MSICQNLTNFFSNLIHDPFGFGKIAEGVTLTEADSIGSVYRNAVTEQDPEPLQEKVVEHIDFDDEITPEEIKELLEEYPFLFDESIQNAVDYRDEFFYKEVETFLKSGADPNALNQKGRSPLFVALNMADRAFGAGGQISEANCRPDKKLIEILLSYGAIVDDKSRLLLTIPNATDNGIDKIKLLDDLSCNTRTIKSLLFRLRLFDNNLP